MVGVRGRLWQMVRWNNGVGDGAEVTHGRSSWSERGEAVLGGQCKCRQCGIAIV